MTIKYDLLTGGATLEVYLGTDDDLVSANSAFVWRGSEAQAAAKLTTESSWSVWERLPIDGSHPLGAARQGKYLGDIRRKDGFAHIWEAYPATSAGQPSGISSPYGAGSIGSAITELVRLKV